MSGGITQPTSNIRWLDDDRWDNSWGDLLWLGPDAIDGYQMEVDSD